MSNINKENKLEKIYTTEPLINHLLDLLDEYYKEPIYQFLEPAAGSGNIIDVIKKRYNNKIIAFDIYNETKRKDIFEYDFLKSKLDKIKGTVTIMNPPFQKGLKFVYKALEISDIVISILSINSWINFDYLNYECDLIEIIKNQPFSDNNKYDICIMVCRNKKREV